MKNILFVILLVILVVTLLSINNEWNVWSYIGGFFVGVIQGSIQSKW